MRSIHISIVSFQCVGLLAATGCDIGMPVSSIPAGTYVGFGIGGFSEVPGSEPPRLPDDSENLFGRVITLRSA